MAFFYAPKAGIDRKRIAPWAVEWMDSNLDALDHVLVEFKIPGGRQVDFLILREDGAYCIEVKDKPYRRVSVNGPWVYRDGPTGSFFDDINSSGENPYTQATNTADSLRGWISGREVANAVFLDRESKIKRNNYRQIEFLKVYPVVLIPETPELSSLERDTHCEICNGPAQLIGCLAKRRWKSSFRLSTDEIARFIQALDLEKVSVLKLVDRSSEGLPPSIAGYEEYCRKLIDDLNVQEPLLEFYVPNTVREIRQECPDGMPLTSGPANLKIEETTDFIPTRMPQARILLQAEGGIGKTTFCHYMCRRAAQEKLIEPSAPLPIYVPLADYLPQGGGLPELISTSTFVCGLNIREDKEDIFQKANLLIFLDGINEIGEQNYRIFLAEVRRWLPLLGRSIIFFTTRATDRKELSLPGLRRFEIQHFDQNQIRTYFEKRGRTDLLEAITAAGASEMLQKPLLLSLALKLGRSFPVPKGKGWAGFYHALLQELLKRELAKSNQPSEFEVLWDDLCELANKMSTELGGAKQELSRNEASNLISDRRFDPAPEHAAAWLRLLSSAGILRALPQRDTIRFCHPLICSFFYAAWLTDPQRGNELESRLSEYAGSYAIFLDFPELSSCFLFRASLLWQDTLRFVFELLLRRCREPIGRERLEHLFFSDPLMAAECRHLFDATEFQRLLNVSLGVSGYDGSRTFPPYTFQPQCKKIVRYIEDSDGQARFVTYQEANAPALVADEVAFCLVVDHSLREQAPRLMERLCRTMQRNGMPYCPSGETRAWGGGRFDTLMNLCSTADLVEVFHRICRDGTVQECRNAAAVFNYLTLQSFFEGMGQQFVQVIEDHGDENGEYEIVDSWDAFQDALPRLELMKVYHATLPEPLPTRQLEAELRVLSIFESCFVIQPFVEAFGRTDKGSSETEIDPVVDGLVSFAREVIDLIVSNPSLAAVPAMEVLKRWHRGVSEENGEARVNSEELELVKWGFAVLSPRTHQMRQALVSMLDDQIQANEAAEAIVRLKFEGLWQLETRFWKRLGDVDRAGVSFTGMGENQSEQREWFDRPLEVFLDALPLQPTDFSRPEGRRCLECELSLGGPPEFLRAARLLLERPWTTLP